MLSYILFVFLVKLENCRVMLLLKRLQKSNVLHFPSSVNHCCVSRPFKKTNFALVKGGSQKKVENHWHLDRRAGREEEINLAMFHEVFVLE